MTPRISRDELYMGVAKLFAQRGTCKRNQVGCTIIEDGRVICSGYNGNIAGGEHCNDKICDLTTSCTKAVHAEANAIAYAARKGIGLEGASIYCTFSPCIKCAELVIQAGIKFFYYEEQYRDSAGIKLLLTNKVYVEKL